nr:MAG TPA: hypothetical protein [Caudoviricetes sp.]
MGGSHDHPGGVTGMVSAAAMQPSSGGLLGAPFCGILERKGV